MKKLSFQILEREKMFQGKFRVDRVKLRHEKMGGGWSDDYEREVFTIGQVAAVLPYDPVRDEVILIEQFRAGAMVAGEEYPWILEPVAGLITETESPEEVATREAQEEAGCELGSLEQIGRIQPSPGGVSQVTRLFVGRVSTEAVNGIYGVTEENEETRPIIVAYKDIPELLSDPKRATNGITIIALQWMLLHHDRLQKEWLGNKATIPGQSATIVKNREPTGPM